MVECQDETRVGEMARDLAACLGRCLGRAD